MEERIKIDWLEFQPQFFIERKDGKRTLFDHLLWSYKEEDFRMNEVPVKHLSSATGILISDWKKPHDPNIFKKYENGDPDEIRKFLNQTVILYSLVQQNESYFIFPANRIETKYAYLKHLNYQSIVENEHEFYLEGYAIREWFEVI